MANFESTLAAALNEKLGRDKRTADSQIEAIDDSGVITLSGTAFSYRARAAADEIARNHPGVLSVINDLAVDDPDATSEVVAIPPLPTDPAYRSQ